MVAIATGGVLVKTNPAPDEDPLADINHAIHIERDLECGDCHTGIESHPAAGVPSIKICAECHDDPEDTIGDTPNSDGSPLDSKPQGRYS